LEYKEYVNMGVWYWCTKTGVSGDNQPGSLITEMDRNEPKWTKMNRNGVIMDRNGDIMNQNGPKWRCYEPNFIKIKQLWIEKDP